MYERPSSPQSIGGVLDNGFKLFKESFSQVVFLSFFGALIGSIPSIIMTRRAEAMTSDQPSPELVFGQIFSPDLIGLFILSMIFSMVIIAAIFLRIDAVANGQENSLGEIFGQAIKRTPALIVCVILMTLFLGIGFLLLIIPGIILSVSLYTAIYFVVIDRSGPFAAIKQSHNLVWGNWWRTAAILSVLFIIAIVFFSIVGLVAGVFAMDVDEAGTIPTSPWWFDFLLIPAISAVLYPLFYAVPYAMWQDLKLRRKGSDLENRMDSLDAA